jgi:hypothetical protein
VLSVASVSVRDAGSAGRPRTGLSGTRARYTIRVPPGEKRGLGGAERGVGEADRLAAGGLDDVQPARTSRTAAVACCCPMTNERTVDI